jgi:phage major head subunit gpT-like protein
MEITQANLDLIFRQADLRFGQVLANTSTWADQIATTIPSNTRQVTYGWMARIPIMRKWVGSRSLNAIATHARTVTNEPFENTTVLERDDVEDDQFGIFNMNISFLAAQATKWPDQQLAAFLRIANTVIGYDGTGVYSTAHPVNGGDVSGGPAAGASNQSNLFVNTALTYDNYVAVRTSMMAYKGEDNQPLTVVPNLLVVPPQLEGAAKLILEADFLAGVNAVNTAPQSNTYKGTAKILMIPELADKPNNWWLLDTTKVVKPLMWQLRQAPRFTYLVNPADYNVFMQKQFVYGVDSRGAAAETLWFLSAAATSAGTY